MTFESICLKFVINYHIINLKLFGQWQPVKWKLLYYIYCIFLVTIVIGLLIFTESNFYTDHGQTHTHQMSRNNYNPAVFIPFVICFILLYITHHLQLREQYKMYSIGMQLIENINDHVNELQLISWIITFIMGSIFINISFISISIYSFIDSCQETIYFHNIIQLIAFIIIYCIIATMENQMYGLILIICYQHKKINEIIRNITDKVVQTSKGGGTQYQNIVAYCQMADDLNTVTILQQRLYNLSVLFNRLFSIQLMLIIAWKSYVLAVEICLEYSLIVAVLFSQENRHFGDVSKNLIILLLNLYGIFAISAASSELTDTVSKVVDCFIYYAII